MSLTSKNTTKQTNAIDPGLINDYSSMSEAARYLASLGFQPNRANTVAAMTPAQEASFASTQDAARAFGMPVAASTGAPAPTIGPDGIAGYSTAASYDDAMSKLPAGFADSMMAYYKRLAGGAAPGGAGVASVANTAPARTTLSAHESSNSATSALGRFTADTARANTAAGRTVSGDARGAGSSIMDAIRSAVSSVTGGKKGK